MTRWYTNVRDLWVEPKTGVVVKGQEQLHQYYGRNKDSVDVEVLKVTPALRRSNHRVPGPAGT